MLEIPCSGTQVIFNFNISLNKKNPPCWQNWWSFPGDSDNSDGLDIFPCLKTLPRTNKEKKPKTQQGKGSRQFSASKARLNSFQQKKPTVEIEEVDKNKDKFSYKTVREKEGKLICRQIHEPDSAAAKMLCTVL